MVVARTFIPVPACSAEMITGAAQTNADVIMLDLEDMTPVPMKVKARDVLRNNLGAAALGRPAVYVRPNGWETGMTNDDLDATIDKGVDGVVVAKLSGPEDVIRMDWKLEEIEQRKGLEAGSIQMQLMIENAKAMMNVYEVATASKRVNAIVFGNMDYFADMKVRANPAVLEEDRNWARARVACAARAAGVVAIDGPYFGPPEGFKENTLYGRQLGHEGRVLADPSLIDLCNSLYTPSPEQMEWARGVSKLYEAESIGKGLLGLTYKGEPIFEPMYSIAQKYLETMAKIEAWEQERSKK